MPLSPTARFTRCAAGARGIEPNVEGGEGASPDSMALTGDAIERDASSARRRRVAWMGSHDAIERVPGFAHADAPLLEVNP